MTTRDRIVVTVPMADLRGAGDGAVDVFAALSQQFFWADTVIVSDDGPTVDRDEDVLEGEIVS